MIDGDNERKLSNFRLDREKKLLALKNQFISEAMKKTEEKFNEYLNGNMKEIIVSLCKDMKEKDFKVKVPVSAGKLEIKDIKTEEDATLENAFVIESGKWKVLFGWSGIRTTMEDLLKEKTGRFFTDNG